MLSPLEKEKLLKRKEALEILRLEIETKIPEQRMTNTNKELMISQIVKSTIDLDPFTKIEKEFREIVEERIKDWNEDPNKKLEELTKEFAEMFTVFTKKHGFWNSLNLTQGLVDLITLFIAVISLVILIWEKATVNRA